MKPSKFFEVLAGMGDRRTQGHLELSPGPFQLTFDGHDIAAGQILGEPDLRDKSPQEVNHALLTGVIQRVMELHENNADFSAETWDDDWIQTFLTAWWWMRFFTVQVDARPRILPKRR